MKKIYREPRVRILAVKDTNLMTPSIDNGMKGNADFNYGGASSGNTEGRAKHHSVWEDEDWEQDTDL